MVGKTALNKEMKHLNGAYFRTIRNPVKETAYRLHFFEPNHMMRFFKQMTRQAISKFIKSIK